MDDHIIDDDTYNAILDHLKGEAEDEVKQATDHTIKANVISGIITSMKTARTIKEQKPITNTSFDDDDDDEDF